MAYRSRLSGLLRQTASVFHQTVKPPTCQTGAVPIINLLCRHLTTSKVFVGGISFTTSESSLSQAFAAHGDVLDVKIIVDRETGRSRGFGFVSFSDESQAEAAIAALDGKVLDGRVIRVDYAVSKPRPAFEPGTGFGQGQGGYGQQGQGGFGGQGSYGQGNYGGQGQSRYGQGSYGGQGPNSYGQGSYGGQGQGSYGQAGPDQSGMGQGSYEGQGTYGQGSPDQSGIGQSSYGQVNPGQSGIGQGSFGQSGFSQNGTDEGNISGQAQPGFNTNAYGDGNTIASSPAVGGSGFAPPTGQDMDASWDDFLSKVDVLATDSKLESSAEGDKQVDAEHTDHERQATSS